MESPFLRPDSPNYADIFADATVHVLGGQGIDRFSIRAVARWMGVVPSTVLGEYSRARVLELVLISFERRWLAWIGSDPLYGPSASRIPLRLPATPDERLGVRVFEALGHLADAEALRGNPIPASHVDRIRREERAYLQIRMRPLCCSAEQPARAVDTLLAFITGLRHSLAVEAPGLDLRTAVDACATWTEWVTTHAEDCKAAPSVSPDRAVPTIAAGPPPPHEPAA